jgi:serine/threonine protein kinase
MVQAPRIGQYQIIKLLGQGGFGTTYLAQDNSSFNSVCVIKQLNPDKVDLEAAKKLFQREAKILASLKEAHQIPKFLAYFEENNNYYLVEEYIEGITLDKLIEREWSSGQIIRFLWDILSILQVLHRNKIIHRDIKPSNLIQREIDSKFVLIDFGAVKQLDDIQPANSGTCISTQGYAPSEQAIGQPVLNSDIYALGMTAIQLLTGIHPKDLAKEAGDNVIWSEKIRHHQSLTEILNKMVKTDPKSRYQSVEEVLKAINQIEDEEKTIILPTSTLKNSNAYNGTQIKFKKNKLWYFVVGLIALSSLVSIELINPLIRPLYYRITGDRLLNKHQSEAALEEFQKAIELNRNDAQAWKGRGDVLLMLGRNEGALSAYEKAIPLAPKNTKTINNKGKVLYKLGDYQQALASHEQALKIEPENNAEAWSGKGLAYIGLGDYQKALESFTKAQDIKPDEPTMWLQKGIALQYVEGKEPAQKFYQEALNVYNDLLAKKQNEPVIWSDRGFVLLQLNAPLDALESYEKALSVDKNFYEALLGKANTLNLLRKPQEALETLDKAVIIRPDDYQGWYNRGGLLEQGLKNHSEALKSFEKVVEIKPDFYPGWLNKGLALTELNRYQEAKEAFEQAKNLNPNDPLIWANLGLVLEKLGEDQEALQSYNEAIKLNFSSAIEYRDNLQQKLTSNVN